MGDAGGNGWQPDVEVRLLGPLDVLVGGESVALGGPRQRTVLAMLALNADRVVSVDALFEAVWGDAGVDRSRGTLQVYVSNLRRLLAAAGGTVIERRDPGYVLNSEHLTIDTVHFDTALEAAGTAMRSGDLRLAVQRFDQALSCCRGDLAADLDEQSFLTSRRAHLAERRLTALEDRLDAQLELGRHAAIVGELETLVEEHPYRERLWGQLMLALYRTGRQADALRAFQRARRALGDDLGLEPGPALVELERAILDHAPSVQTPATLGPALHWVDGNASARQLELDPHTAPITLGRSSEATVVIDWDRRASRDHARLVHDAAGWTVEDGNSRNGTYVNGELIDGARRLTDGDLLQLGDTALLVRLSTTPRVEAVDVTTLVRGETSNG
jgi:DNA-binding SARP family transcriptional activator